MASNLNFPAQLNSDALVNNQLAASIYQPDQGLSLVGNMQPAHSVNNAAVTITNLQALVGQKILSIQNGPLSNTGAVGGVGQEVFSILSNGNVTHGGATALHIDATAVTHAASPYAVLATDTIIPVDTTGGTVTVNLPATATAAGTIYIVKDVGGDAGTNNITVSAGGTTHIDGSTTVVISTNYGVARIFSNGTQYFTF